MRIPYAEQLPTADPTLYLERTQPGDGQELFDFVTDPANHPNLCQYESWPRGFTWEAAEAQVTSVYRRMNEEDSIMQYRLREAVTGRMLGCVTLYEHVGKTAKMGWYVARHAWGHGYAVAAARSLLDYAADAWGLREAIGYIHPANERSQRVAQKLGATKTDEVVVPGEDDNNEEQQVWKIFL
jgi:RimJ/RimL family protein N-acetyltransferase